MEVTIIYGHIHLKITLENVMGSLYVINIQNYNRYEGFLFLK